MGGEHRGGRRPFLASWLGSREGQGVRQEVETARAWGVPVSTFRGRPQAERTTHTYDPDGRLLISETIREAEWTDIDRGLALALSGAEKSLCPCGCGQLVEVAWDPENDGRFEVDTDAICYARQAIAVWQKGEGKDVLDGVLPTVIYHPPADD